MAAQFYDRVEYFHPDQLKPCKRNPRTHSDKQLHQIAGSIRRFGFLVPVLVNDELELIVGHARVLAAKLLGAEKVPVLRVSHLNEAEHRAYLIADNQLALNAGWDRECLSVEFEHLLNLDFDLSVTGFETIEIDLIMGNGPLAKQDGREDAIPELEHEVVVRPGDVWQLGPHRLVCADAQDAAAYDALLGIEKIDMIFTDPPYNVAIDRNVCGHGKVQHREFAMGSGELSAEEFAALLEKSLGQAASRSRNGAIAYVCMDWRHIGELLAAGQKVFSELKNLCVWNKGSGGLGSFYRSQHELVFVWKVGKGRHINNFGLGASGRYRTNVWDYPGINSFGNDRDSQLALHPTAKPVAMVQDAILDCSPQGGLILDCFAGAGSTLIAAHRAKRHARLIELDPAYCDVIIQRFERMTGESAWLIGTGQSSPEVAAQRLAQPVQQGVAS